MEMELEPRVNPLGYKVKAMSRESPTQKATHVLDPDLRSHWSTGTNTKEWILLELDDPCLLSHIRIYNKSVLEWEITVGLRYKPEAFVKVRTRCEAPRRDVIYPMNYVPCRYVRISCLRGNPIAVFFIQLIGVSVTGLEPEFQPVVNYLLPHIISHKQDAHDVHLQLLQDITNQLRVFLPQLETDLNSFTDAAESNIRFLAILAGPFYPILRVVIERETAKPVLNFADSDGFRNNQSSTLTVSSNFEAQPRRSRSPSQFNYPASGFVVFRREAVIMLLRKAYKDSHLGTVCRLASRILLKLVEPVTSLEESAPTTDLAMSASEDVVKDEALALVHLNDYSSLFGEEFMIPEDHRISSYLSLLDISVVEEGIFHILFGCAAQPHLCCNLADSNSDFWSILPLIQALLPALRPPIGTPPEQLDDSFSQWNHPSVQHALSQIVAMSSSSVYRPLLHACSGYLSSFLSLHAKAACVLIDLCSGSLSPWMSTVISKVDLAIELLEDLLGTIQGARQSIGRARAALKYIILALSGHMDDVLAKYKEVKHRLLFLLEMLEAFLDPAINSLNNTIAFGDVSTMFLEKQERNCALALNVIHIAVARSAVLPYLESEWRRGSVAPSVLLSILGPHMLLPSEIDLCKCSIAKVVDEEPSHVSSASHINRRRASPLSSCRDEFEGSIDASEASIEADVLDDANHLFAPPEVRKMVLTSYVIGNNPDKISIESNHGSKGNIPTSQFQDVLVMDNNFSAEYLHLQADYLQLVNHQECEVRAAEFQRLAIDLCSQHDITHEGHDAAIDALLLAAECHVNPFFMMSFRPNSNLTNKMKTIKSKVNQKHDFMVLNTDAEKNSNDLEKIAHIERKRDKIVLEILLLAAKFDFEYQKNIPEGQPYSCNCEEHQQGIEISPFDINSADAVTLVRQNQSLLCHFVMNQLRREQHASHEILLQSLLFLLHSATKLYCPPEDVVDIILQSAENLNGLLTSLYSQFKDGNIQFDLEMLHGVLRRWVLLQRLVRASSGSNDGTDSISDTRNGFQYRCLVPPSSWMQKISKFSNSSFPLARFVGWMAISRYAKQYVKERLFLACNFSELTSLLSIFADELALVENITDHKPMAAKMDESNSETHIQADKKPVPSDLSDAREYFHVLYPDLHKFFPSMNNQFGEFGEIILESVGMQLKCLPSSAVPDLLCWFSDLCFSPYHGIDKGHLFSKSSADFLKGYGARNAKAIILFVFESIVTEHMEAMVPEMPLIAQILLSLCRSSYCDVAFLDSVLCLVMPLISYYQRKVTDDEKLLIGLNSGQDLESLSFEELFDSIRMRKEMQNSSADQKVQGSLVIFILGYLFPNLSFRRMSEILNSLSLWVDFVTLEASSSFYNYLHAFQKVMDNCDMLLAENLKSYGVLIPADRHQLYEGNITVRLDGNSTLLSTSEFPDGKDHSSLCRSTKEPESEPADNHFLDRVRNQLHAEEIMEFSERLESLISKLVPAIEICWKLHYKLAMKLAFASAKCFLFSRCLSSVSRSVPTAKNSDDVGSYQSDCNAGSSKHWSNALEGLTGIILLFVQKHCWQASSATLDYLFGLPEVFSLDCVMHSICSCIKHFCLHAPRISWRLQTDKWLSSLLIRGIGNIQGNESHEASLVDIFCELLGHTEPEQRAVALRLLGQTVGLYSNDSVGKLSYTFCQSLVGSDSSIPIPESIVSFLVSNTWDRVASMVVCDTSMFLRVHAMALLSGYIPFAKRSQLQSFLIVTDTILRGLGKLSNSMEEVHLARLSLFLLANACLYSPDEDIVLIPEAVWKNLESMGASRNGGLDAMEKNLCVALCKLRTEADEAKDVLKKMLATGSVAEQRNPSFRSTRESILQVVSSLSSVQSYFDFFSKKIDQESQELEEAEIELDLLQKEKALQEFSRSAQEKTVASSISTSNDIKDTSRLQQLKDSIRSLEREKLREEILARRQKKLLMRSARQKYLEELASREMELLQVLDSERATEGERSIERQRLLELEQAKTRELRYSLDMKRERQTQRELQQELEQGEAEVRSSRRDFSSNPSRPRERYRERENGRPGQEGSLRPSSRGHDGGSTQSTSSPGGSSQVPTLVLAGSRSFSGQLPTILQPRERVEERSTGYEDSFDGSRDSGDGSTIGDSDLASAFDGLGGTFGSAPPRHGSRGSKSRQQSADRRERDGRREGKWERKHS